MDLVLGIVAGGLITAGVGWYFYKRAGDELRRESLQLREETGRIRHLTNLVLRALEDAGIAQLNRDPEGNPIGLVLLGEAQLTGTGWVDGDGEVEGGDPPERT